MLNKLIDFIALHPRALRVGFVIMLGIFINFFWRRRRSAGLLVLSEKRHETEAAFKVRELQRLLKQARKHYRPDAKTVISMDELQSKRKLRKPGKAAKVKTEAIAVADPRVYSTARLDPHGHEVEFASQELAYFNLFLDPIVLGHFDDLLKALMRHPDELPPRALSRVEKIASAFEPLQTQARAGTPADRLRLGSEQYAELRQWQKRLRTVARLVTPDQPEDEEESDTPAEKEN